MDTALSFAPDIQDARRRLVTHALRGILRPGRASGATLPRTGIHRVLVCRSVHTLGDSLTLTPLLAELAATYPGTEIDIVSGCPVAVDLYGGFPNVRAIFRLPAHAAGHPLATVRALHAMRRKHYDLVIDPDPQSQSGRLLALAAHATLALGYVGPRKSGTLSHGIAVPPDIRHKAVTPVYLLRRALGEDPTARAWPQPRLPLTDAARARGRQTLARLCEAHARRGAFGPRIGIFASATRAKCLDGDWWNAFIEAFQREAPGRRIVEILPAFGRSMLGDRFPCFYSSDIHKLGGLLANLDGYVSADCGVMHLAWAVGTPTVGLFNVTDPGEWGPFGPHMHALRLVGQAPAAAARQVSALLAPQQP